MYLLGCNFELVTHLYAPENRTLHVMVSLWCPLVASNNKVSVRIYYQEFLFICSLCVSSLLPQ
jgi:hypothetical protein